MNPKHEIPVIEHLIRDDQRFTADDHTRRVTIDDQQKFRCELAASQANQQADPIDNELDDGLVTDPLIERVGRGRKQSEARRVLAILDEIGRTDG